MEITPPPASELAAAFLQGTVTLGLAVVCAYLYLRYHKPYFLSWTVAWALYGLRIAAIVTFMLTSSPLWLYWHQVTTGWSGLGFLWAALVFSQNVRWRHRYIALIFFPVIWSYVAIYRMDNFLLAAAPAVVFLSGATAWTGWTFLLHRRHLRSGAAGLLAITLFFWAIHHLDYPFLRARGAWNPWGYYLDILFSLALGLGILLLVLEDVRGGLNTLSELSGQLHVHHEGTDIVSRLLASTLHLGGVRGSAMFEFTGNGGMFTAGVGACAEWTGNKPTRATQMVIDEATRTGTPRVLHGTRHTAQYVAAMPVSVHQGVSCVMVIVGDARDPFAALDERFLLALSQQVGAAINNAELRENLIARTDELERLARRMVHQHEGERQRLARELHDETAQVFSALKLQLGALRDQAAGRDLEHIDRSLTLVDAGIHSIRTVTRALRPPLLDDLGITPALQALTDEVQQNSGLEISLSVQQDLPKLHEERELALYRALQEAYTNIQKHAQARSIMVSITTANSNVLLDVIDDGVGLPPDDLPAELERNGHIGLTGMRERISGLGGSVTFGPGAGGGAHLAVRLPIHGSDT
jgi:signal transduction histidine kinase